MTRHFLRPLLGIVLLCALPRGARGDDGANNDIVAACPGLAAWEQQHAAETGGADRAVVTRKPSLAGVRKQLLRMADRDQAVREVALKAALEPGSPALARLRDVDAANLRELRGILAKHGVPSVAQVGQDGVKAVWLLVQHADDLDLQQRVLEALSAGDSGVGKQELAMMADRIQVARGRPQAYGTQFRKVGGSFVAYDILDKANVDIRRESMDLMPLADYECMLRESYK